MIIDVIRWMAFFLRWAMLGFFLFVVGRETLGFFRELFRR